MGAAAMLCAPAGVEAAGKKTPRKDAALVVAAGPAIGPHAFGNEQCDLDNAVCSRGGRFLGLGGNLEARAKLWKPLYAHLRLLATGNAIRQKPVYSGLMAPGFGLGAYGRTAFVRAEYLFFIPLGPEDFEAPLTPDKVGRAQWTNSAGMFSAGLRLRLTDNMLAEAWGGLTIGPRETRTLFDETETRTLLSFLIGLQLAFEPLPG